MESKALYGIPRPVKPAALPSSATADKIADHEVKTDIYKEDIKEYVQRQSTLQDNMGRAYEVVWGKCSKPMREKVESMNTYQTVKGNSDLLGLLSLIKFSCFDFHSRKNRIHALIEVENVFK